MTLLQYMRDAGVTPDAVAYTALIGLLAKVRRHSACWHRPPPCTFFALRSALPMGCILPR